MSRTVFARIAWVTIALAALIFGIWAIQNVVAGPADHDLGPIVVNTHEPVPPTSPEPAESPTPDEPVPTSPEPAPVQPAPPATVDDDDDWDDDDDDWDDDDDDDWDDDDDD